MRASVLGTAKRNGGLVTPGEVALESSYSMDEAREYLDTLVNKGFAEVRATRTGTVSYVFAEFLTTDGERRLEEL